MTKAVIFCGGTVYDYDAVSAYIDDKSYFICADAGIIHCNKLGIKADLWVGDFDSSDFNTYSKLPAAANAEVIRLNPMKDDTDTEYALDCALARGYKEILLIGAMGTRFDHSLINVFLMEKAAMNNASLIIANENNIIHYVNDSSIVINKSHMKYISVIPLDEVRVTNKGFMYPLNDEILYRNSSRGISNELLDEIGMIYIRGGSAVIIEAKD